MKIYVKSVDEGNHFTTFEIHNVESILASKRYVADLETKRKFGDELFSFIDEAYDSIGGFRSFKDIDRFINDSYLWYITYDGSEPINESELNTEKIYVVSVYRQNHGMKLVGIARRKILNNNSSRKDNINVRTAANAALAQHIKFMSKIGWAEVSHDLEKWFHKVLGDSYIINPYELRDRGIFPDIRITIDDYHYCRLLRKGGPEIEKIAYGTIRW